MADTKLSALTALTGANSAPLDLFAVVDVSDPTMAASGTTKNITRQELQTFNLGTITTDLKILDLSATWNAAGVTFSGMKLNVTDTASAAGSLLMDLQVGGASKAVITKTGKIGAGGGYSYGVPHFYEISVGNACGVQIVSASVVAIITDSLALMAFDDSVNGVRIHNGISLGWTDGNALNAPTLTLHQDSSNVFAQRNGANAQTLRIYNTFTDASNYERNTTTWASNVCYLKNENAGTGAARLLVPVTGSTTVAALPAAATAGQGARSMVTDALTPAFGSAVVAGGAVKIPVFSDGTNWIVG